MKIHLRAYCSYPIFIDQEVEVPDTSEASLEDAMIKICQETMQNNPPLPAIMDGPEYTTVG